MTDGKEPPADPFDRRPGAVYGVAEEVAPLVRRVTARNPSPMTFTGTRTYLVGEGEIAVIDPGPDDPAHRAALLGALGPGQRIGAILVTHTHADHSPGARPLAEATGAPVLGAAPHGAGRDPALAALAALGGGEGADAAFSADRVLGDGAAAEGEGWRLRAVATPGHLGNHLAFALEGDGAEDILFTGDHVMGWATTMVSPPDGDMASFMASLERLAERAGDRLYLPGHGHPVTDPQGMVAHQLAHRRRREAQILAALEDGAADPATLVAALYADVDPRLHGAAARNVLAHLLGLVATGRARAVDPLSANARFALA